jgi:hypothetical protein
MIAHSTSLSSLGAATTRLPVSGTQFFRLAMSTTLDSAQLDKTSDVSPIVARRFSIRFGLRRMFLLMAIVSAPFATIRWVSSLSIILTVCAAVSFGLLVLVYREQDAKRLLDAIKLTLGGIFVGWLLAFLLAPRIMGDGRWVTEVDILFIVLATIAVWLTASMIRAGKEGR